MNRARAEEPLDLVEILPIALALSRFLDSLTQNAARTAAVDSPPGNDNVRASRREEQARAPPSEGMTTLIREQEYSVRQAMDITHRKEVTIRKWLQSGRLPARKEGNRVRILGKDLVKMMALQLSEEPDDAPDDTSPPADAG